jgi:tRNA G18 (ribose-2'-O)-methylase SpoU
MPFVTLGVALGPIQPASPSARRFGARRRDRISTVPVIAVNAGDDERLADYRNIPDPELVERRGIFVAEGRLVVTRLLEQSRIVTRSLMVTDAALASMAPALAGRPGLPVYRVAQPVMDQVAGFNIHRGCLAIGERPPRMRWNDVVAGARAVLVLERIANPDNVGGIFRNALALGADAVLLGAACADPLYRKAIRTSMGAALLVPFADPQPWPEALRQLRVDGFAVIALTPSPAAALLHDAVARVKGRRAALVLGHEGEGLTAEALDACELQARIPMHRFDSLNVASAAAIALYELRRHG